MSQLFQVDLRGLIDLLSDHLYSTPEVYVRELLQNAADAIAARSAVEPAFDADEHPIELEVIRGKTGGAPTLVISDRGIGLTEAEIHQFLATIGQSSKRNLSRRDFIGQFGIGLLSAFIVSDEIILTTRSITEGSPTLQWRGKSDGSYEIAELDLDAQPGSQVYIRAKPGCHDFVDHDVVERLATRYGGHMRQPIAWRHETGQYETLNRTPPWQAERDDESDDERQTRLMGYAEEHFDEAMLDAVPIEIHGGDIAGVAYIRSEGSATGMPPQHRVYCRGVLVSEANDQLLPKWAFFVRGVINCESLQLTANREQFFQDENLSDANTQIGQCLKQYLVALSSEDPVRLQKIIALHALSIKAMAAEDDDFFRLVIDWLPFETSLGVMPLGEFRRRHDTVDYLQTRDEFRQIVSVAASQNIGIINAGYTYDQRLLMKLGELGLAEVKLLDVRDLIREFEPVSDRDRDKTKVLVRAAKRVIDPHGCDVELRKFLPASLPAIYTVDAEAEYFRNLRQTESISEGVWSDVLGALAEEEKRPLLCLNFANPLIQRLADHPATDVLDRSLEILYVQALLLGHFPLRSSEMAVLSDGLIELINAANHFGDEID